LEPQRAISPAARRIASPAAEVGCGVLLGRGVRVEVGVYVGVGVNVAVGVNVGVSVGRGVAVAVSDGASIVGVIVAVD
jgi:hypothetical protein